MLEPEPLAVLEVGVVVAAVGVLGVGLADVLAVSDHLGLGEGGGLAVSVEENVSRVHQDVFQELR